MKKIMILVVIMLCFMSIIGYAQIPETFNYQAVIRDNSGELFKNRNVSVRISILNESEIAIYTETQNTTSNEFGMISLKIGTGTPVLNTFSEIDWSGLTKYIKVEIDETGGSTYVNLGTSELVSVPYALNSKQSSIALNAVYSDTAQVAKKLDEKVLYFTDSDTLFAVKDRNGNIVFAVFPDGAKVFVNETVKGNLGGFAVSGRGTTKGEIDYLTVTPDSTRIYINESVKGKLGGFAVSGRGTTKGVVNDYLFVDNDSTRIYVSEDPVKGNLGGFAVSGRGTTKGVVNDYLQVTKDSTRIYISDSGVKGNLGGFAVSGRGTTKGTIAPVFYSGIDSTRIFTRDSVGGFGVQDNSSASSASYMRLTPLNYFIGHKSGELVKQDILNPGMGKFNTFFGYKAGESSVSSFKNIFLGYYAGRNNVGGGWNIFIGNEAGYNSTGGLSNIFIGEQAGYNLNTGTNNICIGNQSGYNTGSGAFNNLFIGSSSGKSNTSGYYNTYLGTSAGYNAVGNSNTFVGNTSGFGNTKSQNTFVGCESGIYTSTGAKNVCIGYRSGYRSTGSGNVFIGNSANNTDIDPAVSFSNCIAIGDSVIVSASNQIRIGNSSASSLYLMGAYNYTSSSGVALYINSSGKVGTITSSKRYKKDITPLEINSDEIYNLRPVSYTSISDNKRYFGLIAEEVVEVIPELVEFAKEKDVVEGSVSEELIPNSVYYNYLPVLLLNEIQKHEKLNQNYKIEIENLKKENDALKLSLRDILKRLEELEKQ